VAEPPKPPTKKAPQGAFSSSARHPAVKPPAEPDDDPELELDGAPVSFPPDLQNTAGSEEVVLADIVANQPRGRPSSSFPPPLGQAEGHDAWTLGRMSRQSTVPPPQAAEVDRLRALSARTGSGRPDSTSDAETTPPSDGGALDLVDRSRPSQQLDLVGEMEELYALDDLTGALRFAELILGREPDNMQARQCAQNCRQRLVQLYASKIGDLSGVPVQALSENQMRWLGLDHRSGFLLSRVDGLSTIDEVLDVCGMPRLEALKTLVDLLERGAIRVQNR
jgi:hypothetical protein